MPNFLTNGFSAATLIPALASALKQSQREGVDHLHLLADYYNRQKPYSRPQWLTRVEKQAACEIGVIMVDQGFNCAVLYMTVNAAAVLAGPLGGMLVQVGITWNTIVTPDQSQKVNPARLVGNWLGKRPDWVSRLPEDRIERFALLCGKWASSCGYGTIRPALTAWPIAAA